MKKKIKMCGAMLATAIAAFTFVLSGKTAFADETANTSMNITFPNEELPESVDWSTSKYFPEVGDQGPTGSCWHYGNIHASLTFATNQARDRIATSQNIINPIFGYNYAQKTKVTQPYLVNQIGYPSVEVLPIDHSELLSLYPTAEVWESAILNRGGMSVNHLLYGDEDNIITGPKDPSLYLLKKTLSDGDLAVVCSYSYKWNYTEVASGEHKGEKAIDRLDSNNTGGHVVAFVGYDDNIWIDINHDGKQQTAELGAFKMINSWGKDWGNNGFIWVAYDSLNVKSQVITDEDVTRINNAIDAGTIKGNKVNNKYRGSFFMFGDFVVNVARERITSNCWFYMTVNTGSRREMTLSITATNKKDGSTSTYTMPKLTVEDKDYSWDGKTQSTDGTMVLDLDNVISDITPETMENYTWQVTFEDDTLDDRALTVKDIHFKVNGVKRYLTSVSKVPLNGTKKTYDMKLRTSSYTEDATIKKENETNVIIYYNNSSYMDANIHYKVGSGKWTTAPGVQMCADESQEGYKWKFVVNLGDATTLTACFNNGNGTWDNNSSKDYSISGPGCYGIKSGKIVKLEEIEKEEDPILELDKTSVTLNAGDKVTVKADIWPADTANKTVTWTTADKSVATVSGGVITGVAAGKTTITATLSNGTKATCEVTVKASAVKELKGTTVASKTTVTSGGTVTFTTTATGGTGSYKYSIIVHNKTTNEWARITNKSTSNQYSWKAGSAGKRIFYVDITDASGKTVRTAGITVTTTVKELKATSTASSTKVVVGDKIKLTATATGGTGSYKYSYIVHNKTTNEWARIKDKSTSNTYTWEAGSAGTRVFYIDVTDASGKTVRAEGIIVVTEKAKTLKVTGSTTATTLSVGGKATIKATVSGGTSPYKYSFVVYNRATKEWFRYSFKDSSSLTWTASSKGTRVFYVEAKDAKGNVVRSEGVTITVK